MSTNKQSKSLEEINQEIEEELKNYKPEDDADNKKKRNILFTVPGIIILLIVFGLAFYRIFHFFFLI